MAVTNAIGGRKFALLIFTTLLFMAFGWFCVEKDVELSDAAVFVAAVTANSLGYMHFNVKAKNGNGKKEG